VNIHRKAKNIYTSNDCGFSVVAAWQKRHNCKMNCARTLTAMIGMVRPDRESAVNS